MSTNTAVQAPSIPAETRDAVAIETQNNILEVLRGKKNDGILNDLWDEKGIARDTIYGVYSDHMRELVLRASDPQEAEFTDPRDRMELACFFDAIGRVVRNHMTLGNGTDFRGDNVSAVLPEFLARIDGATANPHEFQDFLDRARQFETQITKQNNVARATRGDTEVGSYKQYELFQTAAMMLLTDLFKDNAVQGRLANAGYVMETVLEPLSIGNGEELWYFIIFHKDTTVKPVKEVAVGQYSIVVKEGDIKYPPLSARKFYDSYSRARADHNADPENHPFKVVRSIKRAGSTMTSVPVHPALTVAATPSAPITDANVRTSENPDNAQALSQNARRGIGARFANMARNAFATMTDPARRRAFLFGNQNQAQPVDIEDQQTAPMQVVRP
jgi:hypothetical protein